MARKRQSRNRISHKISKCEMTKKEYEKIKKMMKIKERLPLNNTYCQFLEKHIPSKCIDGYKITGYIGGGEFGRVLAVCNKYGKTYAMKIVFDDPYGILSPQEEVRMQKYAAKHRMAPKIYHVCKKRIGRKDAYFIVMEKVDGIIGTNFMNVKGITIKEADMILSVILRLIKDMRKIKFTHGDLHWENIGFNVINNKIHVFIIDFGQSIKGEYNTDLEYIQLLRTAFSDFNDWKPSIRNHIKRVLYDLYVENYNEDLKLNIKDVEREWRYVWDDVHGE